MLYFVEQLDKLEVCLPCTGVSECLRSDNNKMTIETATCYGKDFSQSFGYDTFRKNLFPIMSGVSTVSTNINPLRHRIIVGGSTRKMLMNTNVKKSC